MRFIVGLGNPETKYKNNRHNAGFMVVEAIARQYGSRWQTNKKFMADIADGGDIILAKPQTYMNNSGQSVFKILSFYKRLPKFAWVIQPQADLVDTLTVVHDDIDLPLGSFKIQTNRSAAGHNGVQSIINHLKTKNFTRVRVGIATPLLRTRVPAEKFVLADFPPQELQTLQKTIPHIIDALSK